jgi:hypothetical protein
VAPENTNPRAIKMSPWFVNPSWQNFSSLYREAITAREAKTGMEKVHHLTASLYFGIATLEAFLNQKMRAHLEATKSEEEIFKVLRKGQIMWKVEEWPEKLLGKPLDISHGTLNLITFYNRVRGDLTHPKTHGHDVYEGLESVDPISLIASVAEYVVRFHEAEGTRFPYWLFGWNYLNPGPDSYDIFPLRNDDFCWSLQALGFHLSPSAEAAQRRYFGTFEGYLAVRQHLSCVEHCEPKTQFAFKPTLFCRWWTPEHQRSCGSVARERRGDSRR